MGVLFDLLAAVTAIVLFGAGTAARDHETRASRDCSDHDARSNS